jgi:hypothetical protein
MTDTSELMSALTGENKRPIWPFAVPAILIASIWAAVSAAIGARDHPPAEILDAPSLTNEAAYALGGATVPAVLVWVAFQILALHRRPFRKSLWVLGLMIAFSFMLALPARLASVGGMPIADVGGAVRWSTETRDRFQGVFADFSARVPPDRFRAALTEPTPDVAAVEARLAQVRTLAAAVRQHLARIDEEEAQARRALADLDLSAVTRAQRTAWLDAQLGRSAQARQMPTLMLQLLQQREQMLALVQAHPGSWTPHGGQLLVHDAALRRQLQEMDAEFAATYAQFREVIRANAPPRAEPDGD